MNSLTSLPDDVFFYGEKNPLPTQKKLNAGPLEVIYENGSLRYISLNGFEVVRMIYSAVRDHNWDTVEPEIKNEKVTDNGDNFFIEYDAEYRQGEIHFLATYKISGSQEGNIDFEMEGNALSSFRKNRVGFCILHPIKECVGRVCEITEPDGEKYISKFPELISPHQPFKNIKAMRWPLMGNSFATINFEGEIFETEDQRNWTDASFKTYCTPLELPFPVTIDKGAQVKQLIQIRITGTKDLPNKPELSDEEAVFTILNDKEALKFPSIGVGRSSEVSALSSNDIDKISNLGLHHYRVEVKPYENDWKKSFIEAVGESKKLKLSLEVALHLEEKKFENQINSFINEFTHIGGSVYAIILFQKNHKTTPEALIKSAIPLLRENFPSAKIGGGTDAYFAELNRNRPPAKDLDFLTYSINPQVHAFDNASLTETLEAQGYTVESAESFASGNSIHVSPVTLKPRFNPNATGPEPEPGSGELPSQVDVRQRSLFAAGWTLGSIKYLAEAGVESITYFEAVGKRGLLMPEIPSSDSKLFPAEEGEIFPVYGILKEVLNFKVSEVILSKSNRPLEFDGLVLRQGNKKKILLGNLLNKDTIIKVPDVEGGVKIIEINSSTLRTVDWISNLKSKIINKDPANEFSVSLPPYGIAILEDKI
ncbi:hypothetical protein BH23BAC1_BH23BAC1_32000 [soil metagenome]